jgi:uncharacterized protein (DUF433 family)
MAQSAESARARRTAPIAAQHKLQGMTPEELVAEFPHLTLASVHDALSYYYDHREEIDADTVARSLA